MTVPDQTTFGAIAPGNVFTSDLVRWFIKVSVNSCTDLATGELVTGVSPNLVVTWFKTAALCFA